MFSGLSVNQDAFLYSSNDFSFSGTEDDDYDEFEENHPILEDGIDIDENYIDEYEDFDDEMESDIPEPEDSEILKNSTVVDEIEAEHYDSLEDE